MKQYKLCGFLNMFDIVPDFVYPIFQNGNKYFFQEGKNDKIENFVPVKESIYPLIQEINELKTKKNIENKIFTIGSRPFYAFQTKKNKVICGNAEFILRFFNMYKTNNIYLKEEIEDFKQELYDIKGLLNYDIINDINRKAKLLEFCSFCFEHIIVISIPIFIELGISLKNIIIFMILYFAMKHYKYIKSFIKEKCEDFIMKLVLLIQRNFYDK